MVSTIRLIGLALLGLAAASVTTGPAAAQDSPGDGPPDDARASLIDADGNEVGVVHVVAPSGGGTHVSVFVRGLAPGMHGLHVHAGETCTDEAGNPDFAGAGGHLGHDDPDSTPHGTHTGDLPPLYVTGDGIGTYGALTWRAQIDELVGRTLMVHADPDNLAHIPDRYHLVDAPGTTGPDEATRTTGDAGDRVACGEIEEGVPELPDRPADTARGQAELLDGAGERIGQADLVGLGDGTVAVSHSLDGVSPGLRGFHIHAGGTCTDESGQPDFSLAEGHYNPEGDDHGEHAGDLPAALVAETGVTGIPPQGSGVNRTDQFDVADVMGRAVIVHADPDNLAHIPDRYQSDDAAQPGPDEATLATGDAGPREACGVIEPSGQARRLAGATRFETALATSQSAFPETATAVVLARADRFADGLAGAPLADANDAPLLLTPSDRLHPGAAEEITRVLPDGGTVYLLGGTEALSPAVADAVADLGASPQRIGGPTRVHTALEIAGELDDPATRLVTTGFHFPDALGAAAAAAHTDGAVLLTPGEQRHPAVDAYLDRTDGELIAVGGPAARPYDEAEAVVGGTRIQTAVAVAERFFDAPAVAGLARQGRAGDDTDETFADALTGGAHIAGLGGPLLLTPTTELHAASRNYLGDNADTLGTVYLYGGLSALHSSVESEAGSAIGGP